MKCDLLACLLTVCVCGAASAATPASIYAKSETNDWFAVESTDLGAVGSAIATGAVGGEGAWSAVPAEGTAVVGGTDAAKNVTLDTDLDDPLSYAATSAYAGGEVALIKARFVVSANVAMPSAGDFASAQAALSVYTNTQSGAMNWIGLVKGTTTAEWVTFDQAPAAVGETVEVIIEFDNSATPKRIRYSVKENDDDGYVVLTTGSGANSWFSNAKDDATSQAGVSFVGTGSFDRFTGEQVCEATRATLSVKPMAMGFDFTNGTVKVDVSGYHKMTGVETTTLYLTVKDAGGNTVGQKSAVVSGNGTDVISFTLPKELDAGARYVFDLQLKETVDGSERAVAAVTSGDVLYAGVSANWFDAKEGQWSTQGTWKDETGTALDPQPSGASIALTGQLRMYQPTNPSTGAYVRVVADVDITGLFDTEDFESAQTALALATTSDEDETPVWKAWVRTGPAATNWVSLTGAPTTLGRKSIRTEFDYEQHKVRFAVMEGGVYQVLKDVNETEWFDNIEAEKLFLARVDVAYSGALHELKGDNANHDLALAGGVAYTNLYEALESGSDVTLLWDVTYAPDAEGEWNVDKNGKDIRFVGDNAWRGDYKDGKLRVAAGYVAAIGDTKYIFLDKAFAALAGEEATIKLLTNVVAKLSYEYPSESTTKVALDLDGWCLVSNALESITVPTGAGLTITNTANTQGAVDLAFAGEGTTKIAAGLYTTAAKTVLSDKLLDGYKFIEVAYETNLYGRTFVCEARRFESTKEPDAVIVIPSASSGVTNVAEVIVDRTWAVDKAGVSFSTPEAKEAAVKTLNGPAANGISYVDNYALGIDTISATAKPVTLPVQNADSGKIKFMLGNIAPRADAGVQVNYCIEEADTPDAATPAATSAKFPADQPAEITLPTGSVRYYKIRITLDPKN